MLQKLMVLVFAAALVFSGSLFAQEQTGEFLGTVSLEDGSVVPGVAVEAKGSNLVGSRTTVTDENGAYRFPALPPGVYTLTYSLEGFKTVVRKDLELQIGKNLKLDVTLEAGAIEENVVVEGKTPLVDVRQSAVSSNISKETFSKLPRGRNYDSVMNTTSGVNYEEGGNANGFFINGASLSENTFFVDGMNTTNIEGGLSGQSVNTDGIEEVQVKTAGYSAEYGGSMGGVISVITRTGGNEFHGELGLYYDADWLGAQRHAPLIIDPLDDAKAIYDTGERKDKYTSIEPSLSLGGYIIKDRVWFYTSVTPRWAKWTRSGRYLHDEAMDGTEYEQKNTYLKGSAKLTAALTNNIRLSVGGTMDRTKQDGSLPLLDGTSDSATDFAAIGYTWPGSTLTATLDWTLGNNAFLSLSGGMFYTNFYDSGSKSTTPPVRLLFQNSNEHLDIPDEFKHPAYWNNITFDEVNANVRDIAKRYSAKGDFTYYLNAGGEHVLKAGVAWEQVHMDKQNGTANEYWRFYWKNGSLYDHFTTTYSGETFPTTYGYVRAYQYGELGKTKSDRWALYLQDSWTLKERLTLNFGVRLEKEDMPSFGTNQKPFSFDFFDKIAPRVGFSYDLNGDGKNKIFGNFGLYYDVMKLDMAVGSFGGATYWRGYWDIADYDLDKWLNVKSNIWDPTVGPNDPILGGQNFEYMNLREPSFDTVQPDLKPYSKMEFSLGYARMLNENWSLTAQFLYNKVLNAIEDVGVQTPHGEMYYIANPGSDWIQEQFATAVDDDGNPLVPSGFQTSKPKRTYTQFKLDLDRKFANNWFVGASVTLSRTWGNFSGLGSSDEDNRINPMVQRYFDIWYMHLKQDLSEATGLLPTDRPLDVRLKGAYSFDFGLTVGADAFFQSGVPLTFEVPVNSMDGYYPLGRGTEGRSDMLWQLNMYVEQSFKLGERFNLSVAANIDNVTNNKIATRKYMQYNYENVGLSNEEIRAGYDIWDVMSAQGTTMDPRYGMGNQFQGPINAYLSVKLTF